MRRGQSLLPCIGLGQLLQACWQLELGIMTRSVALLGGEDGQICTNAKAFRYPVAAA